MKKERKKQIKKEKSWVGGSTTPREVVVETFMIDTGDKRNKR